MPTVSSSGGLNSDRGLLPPVVGQLDRLFLVVEVVVLLVDELRGH